MINYKRCSWPGTDESMISYHNEWGVPVQEDRNGLNLSC